MARRLREQLASIDGLRLLFPTEANSVFVEMPPAMIAGLHATGWHFYTFIGQGGCRLMCAWDTREEDVAALVDAIQQQRVRGDSARP